MAPLVNITAHQERGTNTQPWTSHEKTGFLRAIHDSTAARITALMILVGGAIAGGAPTAAHAQSRGKWEQVVSLPPSATQWGRRVQTAPLGGGNLDREACYMPASRITGMEQILTPAQAKLRKEIEAIAAMAHKPTGGGIMVALDEKTIDRQTWPLLKRLDTLTAQVRTELVQASRTNTATLEQLVATQKPTPDMTAHYNVLRVDVEVIKDALKITPWYQLVEFTSEMRDTMLPPKSVLDKVDWANAEKWPTGITAFSSGSKSDFDTLETQALLTLDKVRPSADFQAIQPKLEGLILALTEIGCNGGVKAAVQLRDTLAELEDLMGRYPDQKAAYAANGKWNFDGLRQDLFKTRGMEVVNNMVASSTTGQLQKEAQAAQRQTATPADIARIRALGKQIVAALPDKR